MKNYRLKYNFRGLKQYRFPALLNINIAALHLQKVRLTFSPLTTPSSCFPSRNDTL